MKRKVFYIPGFDPMPPRRYRELYRREGQKQASISGYTLEQGFCPKAGTSGWHITAHMDEGTAKTDFECLIWADIVKASMKPSFWNIYIRSFINYSNYITSGALRRITRVRFGPAVVALYPPIITLIQLLLGLLIMAGMFSLFSSFHAILGVLFALGAGIGWFYLMRRFDRGLFAHYLMLDYSYYAADRGALPGTLDARLDQFTIKVLDALKADYDEVLIVGHSSGVQLAINVAARVLRWDKKRFEKLGLLTLAHSVPMTSFMPKAQYMRRDMLDLADYKKLMWLDVSAPGDGACFALADPVAISGVSPEKSFNPKILSASFSKTLSEEQKQKLRGRFFKKHFQYLCAFENPGQYDYFALTAGPQPFQKRIAGLKESPSKITTIYSHYTDV